jgi:outer membrane protein OmpA-like peptidoglycan-associated protein
MQPKPSSWSALAIGAALIASGCATKKYVNTQVDETRGILDERVAGVETQIEDAQVRLDTHDTEIDEMSQTAREALERAIAAGQLAEGKFLFETVLTDDSVHFGFDEAALSEEAHSALGAFAEQVKASNDNVYIEIQGHTDATGSEGYNLTLGERRAEAVRRYLSQEQGFALHRLAVISYGESAPMADNGTRDGRSQNRRVALVVLK